MKKLCRELKIVSYHRALKWIKSRDPHEATPVHITKYGGRSNQPFRVWCFADLLLLMPNEDSVTQSHYVIDRKKWDSFWGFVKKNPNMGMGELAKRYKDYCCDNITYWPSIISISKAVIESENNGNL